MEFINEFAFLNCHYPCDVKFNGDLFYSVHDAYEFASNQNFPDWETTKVIILENLLIQKFKFNDKFRELLRNTCDLDLGNSKLAQMIIKIRKEIHKEDGYPMKICIAGSRNFNDYELLKEKMDHYLEDQKNPIIVLGGARGADTLGEKYAIERGYCGEKYPAEWDKYGKQAGYIRNEVMANVSDCAVVFWDGSSKGSEHMIKTMRKLGKPVRVVKYNV